MGIAGHNRFGMLFRLIAEGTDQFFYLGNKPLSSFPQVKADIQRNLVVPAPGGVEPLSRVPDAGGQLCFYKHMDVLGFRVKGKFAAVQVRQDRL